MKIIGNPLILAQVTYPGWLAAGRSKGARGAREEAGSARGGAAGVPESRNTLGMLLGLSLPISMAMGDPRAIFCLESKNYTFFARSGISSDDSYLGTIIASIPQMIDNWRKVLLRFTRQPYLWISILKYSLLIFIQSLSYRFHRFGYGYTP